MAVNFYMIDILVYSLAILDDNYSYIVVEKHGRFAVVIDPADPYIIQVYS